MGLASPYLLLLQAAVLLSTVCSAQDVTGATRRSLKNAYGQHGAAPQRVSYGGGGEYKVPWESRDDPEADYRAIERKATITSRNLLPDSHTASRTEMQPLIPKIEAQDCLMKLVRPYSPVSRSASRKYIPKAYNLLNRKYDYKTPLIPEAFKTPCFKKCALVGSSGVMKGTKWGAVIDTYDAVIRLNNAPTYGHEEDVGSRTTVRIMHDFHIKEHNLGELLRMDPGGFIAVWPPEDKPKGLGGPSPKPEKTKHLAYWLEYANATMMLTRFSRAGFYDSHMMARAHVGPFPPHVPSTGWNAFYAILHFCQEIHAYGLAWQLSEESYKRAGHTEVGKAYYWYKHEKGNVNEDDYYYKRNIKNPNSFHGFDKEKIGMQALAAYYKVTFL